MYKIKPWITFSIAITLFTSCSSHKIHLEKSTSLNTITIDKPALYPETLVYNTNTNTFIVGSFRDGKIYSIDDKGKSTIFIDDTNLNSVLGIKIDYKRDRLLALSSDVGASLNSYSGGVKKEASLGIYNLSTGKLIHFVNLGKLKPNSPHLANGVTIDDSGNAYVTDSFSPIIYKIDLNGNTSIFLENDNFIGNGINLNGIVFHPDGYLITIKKSDGILFKIPLSNPENFSKIKIDKKFLGGDGLCLTDNNNLLICANIASGTSTESLFSLQTKDNWLTATITNELYLGEVYPTTVEVKNNEIYVIYSNLNELHNNLRDKQKKLKRKATIQQIGTLD